MADHLVPPPPPNTYNIQSHEHERALYDYIDSAKDLAAINQQSSRKQVQECIELATSYRELLQQLLEETQDTVLRDIPKPGEPSRELCRLPCRIDPYYIVLYAVSTTAPATISPRHNLFWSELRDLAREGVNGPSREAPLDRPFGRFPTVTLRFVRVRGPPGTATVLDEGGVVSDEEYWEAEAEADLAEAEQAEAGDAGDEDVEAEEDEDEHSEAEHSDAGQNEMG